MTFECWYTRLQLPRTATTTTVNNANNLQHLEKYFAQHRNMTKINFQFACDFFWSVSSVQNYANLSKQPKKKSVLKCCDLKCKEVQCKEKREVPSKYLSRVATNFEKARQTFVCVCLCPSQNCSSETANKINQEMHAATKRISHNQITFCMGKRGT